MSRRSDIITLVLAAGLLAAPLALRPALVAEPFRGPGLEERVQAAFPFRSTAQRSWNGVRWLVFRSTPPTVVQGRGGWLYYRAELAGDGHAIDDHLGQASVLPAEAASWAEAVRRRAARARARGARYLAIVPPNKEAVSGAMLPASLPATPAPSRLDALLAALGADAGDLIDLRAALRAAPEAPFPAQDSHWTDAGAHAAYLAIMSALGREAEALPRSAFIARRGPVGGDLRRLAMAPMPLEDLDWLEPLAAGPAVYAPEHGGAAVFTPGVRPLYLAYNAIRTREGRDEVLSGIDDPRLPTALVFHDSFMPQLWPFLAQHFRRLRCVRGPYVQALVDAEAPDLVIDEHVQRNVHCFGLGDAP